MALPKWKPPARGSAQVGKLKVAQALNQARSLLAQGDLAAAEKVLSVVLKALPRQPGALHLMGAMLSLRGESARALVLLEQAIQLQPADASVWNDIGLVYGKLARFDDAIVSYQRCISLAGETELTAKALDNLGRLQLSFNAMVAEQSFRRATQCSPCFGLAWYGLAQALIQQDKLAEGLEAAHEAVRLMPRSMARVVLASALSNRGHQQAAIDFYQQILDEDPDNPRVLHHLKALKTPLAPERASDAYISATFDGFAATFDNKLARLQYLAPQLVCATLQSVYPHAQGTLDVVDAGCGTGWCGPLLKPWAKRLVGVDLSSAMLDKARQRAVYSELHHGELTLFLGERPATFDVVVSADTLIYFGDLTEVLTACQRALRVGGHVFFTLEALSDDSLAHRLAPHGRYAHSRHHVGSAAKSAGLLLLRIEQHTLRIEHGEPVAGWVVSLQKPL